MVQDQDAGVQPLVKGYSGWMGLENENGMVEETLGTSGI